MSKDTEYIDEGVALLRGVPAVEFQPPADVIVADESGELHHAKSQAWVKFSTAFRAVLPKLKGAPLSVFVSIGLHVNDGGRAWPSINTLCSETGYSNKAVSEAIKTLKREGVIKAMRRKGSSTVYLPVYFSYGKNSTPPLNYIVPPPKTTLVPPPKTTLKEEPEKKNQEAEGGADKPRKAGEPKPRKQNATFDAIAGVCAPTDEGLKKEYVSLNGGWIARIAANGVAKFAPEQIARWYGAGGWWYTVRCKGMDNPPRPTPESIKKTISLAAEWDVRQASSIKQDETGGFYV